MYIQVTVKAPLEMLKHCCIVGLAMTLCTLWYLTMLRMASCTIHLSVLALCMFPLVINRTVACAACPGVSIPIGNLKGLVNRMA